MSFIERLRATVKAIGELRMRSVEKLKMVRAWETGQLQNPRLVVN
jgi:hypothetical protein